MALITMEQGMLLKIDLFGSIGQTPPTRFLGTITTTVDIRLGK